MFVSSFALVKPDHCWRSFAASLSTPSQGEIIWTSKSTSDTSSREVITSGVLGTCASSCVFSGQQIKLTLVNYNLKILQETFSAISALLWRYCFQSQLTVPKKHWNRIPAFALESSQLAQGQRTRQPRCSQEGPPNWEVQQHTPKSTSHPNNTKDQKSLHDLPWELLHHCDHTAYTNPTNRQYFVDRLPSQYNK